MKEEERVFCSTIALTLHDGVGSSEIKGKALVCLSETTFPSHPEELRWGSGSFPGIV